MTVNGSGLKLTTLSARIERIHTTESPTSLFSKVQRESKNAFLLESATGDEKLAEYSFVGFDPSIEVSVKNAQMRITEGGDERSEAMPVNNPLQALKAIMPYSVRDDAFRFFGGAVGYVSYDSIRYLERIPTKAKDGLLLPDMEFGIYNDGVVFDHRRGETFYFTLGESRLGLVEELLAKDYEESDFAYSKPSVSLPQQKFEEMVEQAKEYIMAGDIFQVVLSKRHDFEKRGDLMRFYRSLSAINPSPYMYFLKFGDRKIVGSSPEMLARVENRRVETFPIAGTRPHVADPAENSRLTRELLTDKKERAEHMMLVDLARNDVGRVSKYGSVAIPELFKVHQFSDVQHIVSHVTGDLVDQYDAYDTLAALFPAGTVSGAPKVRAMEIIEELEPFRRGPYAGAVGYFSFNGNADFAITIRTLVANRDACHIQAGAGIVADSVPEMEWEETERKAAGLIRAVEHASGENP